MIKLERIRIAEVSLDLQLIMSFDNDRHQSINFDKTMSPGQVARGLRIFSDAILRDELLKE